MKSQKYHKHSEDFETQNLAYEILRIAAKINNKKKKKLA